MGRAPTHTWEFKRRFRARGFGWRSQPAVKRVKEAVAEILKVARKNPALGGEGAVAFLVRVSPAIEQVDGSSGSLGNAVNRAIKALVPVIAAAPVDEKKREAWLEDLFEAIQNDDPPYLELLGDHWGELCASPAVASRWADRLAETLKMAWSPDPALRGFFPGTTACLSSFLAAGRYQELLALLELCPHPFLDYRAFGARALAAEGRYDEALAYLHDKVFPNDSPAQLAQLAEEILIAAGRCEEAFERFGEIATWRTNHLATFRALVKKYPHKPPLEILRELIDSAPADKGRWFAAAKSIGELDLALELAVTSPCDPRTLTRAAREFAESRPVLAVHLGLAALHWIDWGYGYKITGADVRAAFLIVKQAAGIIDRLPDTLALLKTQILNNRNTTNFVGRILARDLGLPPDPP